MSEWFEHWFGEEYLELYPHRDAEEAARVAELLEARGVVRPGARVLDLACGAGRHAMALAHRGARVVGLDLSTPLDFCSTADTYGGNSGSPAVTKDLQLVGLNFDRNIDALGRDFIYLPEQGRNVMVDVRAIQASLDKVYGAHRVLQELRTGQLVRTEAEADAGR